MMTLLERWAETYGIEQATLAELVSGSEHSFSLRTEPRLLYTILRTNSSMVKDFLAALPAPKQPAESQFAVSVDLLFSGNPGIWRPIFQDDGHPAHFFEERGEAEAVLWDEQGCLYRLPSKREATPTYLHVTGFWPKGWEALDPFLYQLLEKKYIVYSAAVGTRLDLRQNVTDLGFRKMGVSSTIISYSCRAARPYDPSASIQVMEDDEELLFLWDGQDAARVQRKIAELQATFIALPEITSGEGLK